MVASAGNANEAAAFRHGFAAYFSFPGSTESIRRRLVYGSSPHGDGFMFPQEEGFEPGLFPHVGPNAHSSEGYLWTS
jgi:hypothetical protein